jgi:hypothetical protein
LKALAISKSGDLHRDIPRTFTALIEKIDEWIVAEEENKKRQRTLALEQDWKKAA